MIDSGTLAIIGVSAVALAIVTRRIFGGGAVALRLFRARRTQRRDADSQIGSAPNYHTALPASERAEAIDDHSWADLDLDEVFLSLDHTVSQPGRQYLYHLLRTPRFAPDPLDKLEQSIRRVGADGEFAERIRSALAPLDDSRAARLVNLIFGDLPRRPALWWMFPVLTLASIICLAAMAAWPRALLGAYAICVANIGIQIFYKPRIKEFVPALHEIPAFIRAAELLGGLDIPECAGEIERLRDAARQLGMLRRLTWWLMFEPGQTNELAATVYEYVNLLLLLDVTAFAFAAESLHALRGTLRAVFDAAGYLDAVQSIAAWRETLPQWTAPDLVSPAKTLDVRDVIHPLLANPVANSLNIHGAGVLITGSNMSGKTTFVRAVGLNAVLAQTVHTVCATVWRAPMLQVRTSIGRADSVIEGKSYYLAEVLSVGALVAATGEDRQHLFLLDEIFRGTNTTERVAAAFAVLRYLNRGNDIVIVATHDIEVIALLGDRYTPYHFREEIALGAITFDYQLHAGPASTRNAIALLELMNYPSELVAEALATLDWKDRAAGGP